MADRNATYVLKNSNIVNRSLPTSLLLGEPIVNTADGILLFSGNSISTNNWTEAGLDTSFFEVGSNLYDLKIRNKITSYQNVSGVNLVDKILLGTSNGFVLSDVNSIPGITGYTDTYLTGGTYSNGNTIFRNNLGGNFNVSGYFTGITSSNVTTALGYTPYNNTNPNGYISGITSNNITTALGYVPLSAYTDTYLTGGTYSQSTGISTFRNNSGNTFSISGYFTGYTLTTSAITSTLGYTPYSNTNPNGYISGITSSNVTTALGYIPLSAYTDIYLTGGTYNNGTATFTNNSGNTFSINGFNTGYTLTTSAITDSLGYIPYDSTNPNGYITTYTDTYVSGFTYNPLINELSISKNDNTNYNVSINSFSGISISNLEADRLVYTTIDGKLITNPNATFDGNNLVINEITPSIYNNLPNDLFLKLDGSNANVDIDLNVGFGFGLSASFLKTYGGSWSSGKPFFFVDPINSIINIGDYKNNLNNTYLILDDANQLINFNISDLANLKANDNKILTELDLTNNNITTALGYTPYNSTNPNGYISGITSSNVTTALGYIPLSAYTNTYVTGGTYSQLTGVSTFRNNSGNTFSISGYFTGITSSNVTNALGYVPYNSTNPNGYISGITSSNVTNALGYVPLSAYTDTYLTGGTYSNGTTIFTNNSGNTFSVNGFNTGYTLSSSAITDSLGYVPYNSTNPSGFTNNLGTVTSVSALNIDTLGTDLSSSVANNTTTPVITLNVPTASAINRGVLSNTDWTNFNNKLNNSTLTSNFIPKYVSGTTLSNSLIQDNGTNVGIGGISTANKLTIVDTTLAGIGLSGSLLDLQQTWNTSGAPIAIKLNVSNNASGSALLLDLQVNTVSMFSVDKTGLVKSAGGFQQNILQASSTNSGVSLRFKGTDAAFVTYGARVENVINGNIILGTTGNFNYFQLTDTAFTPTSGNGTFNSINLSNTISQTGGASGTTRGIYINPTLTSAFDYRAIDVQNGKLMFSSIITASGTTGNQTINKISGKVNAAIGTTSLVVTNNLVTSSSIVICQMGTNDATARITSSVESNGSFTINYVAPTAETVIKFFVIN